jgi:SAM-dependent methyltransferase
VAERDRLRWDERYLRASPAADRPPALPPVFAPFAEWFPADGTAIDLACGPGQVAAWLAGRGLRVWGCDVSPVAIGLARALADRCQVADRCRFAVVDLDDGLPDGPPADVIVCHLFRDAALDGAIVDRLSPGGLLAMAVLSEVGDRPGPFRAAAGELPTAFSALHILAAGERDGKAWLLGRRPQSDFHVAHHPTENLLGA